MAWLRWGEYGFVCHICGDVAGWPSGSGYSWECGGCKSRISPTAGTIFHRTRTPLTIWFEAAWLLTTQSYGASALGLQRVLGLGSYQTAWTMLHKFRAAMVDPSRTPLDGDVEGDEVFIGGKKKAGKPGRSKKAGVSVVICLVEKHTKGFGRTRLVVVPDASAASIEQVLRDNVARTATIHTDAWNSWKAATKNLGLAHQWTSVAKSGSKAHVTMPAVSRVAAQLKRWLFGTMQGAVSPEHLQSYCYEFEFRFNRRRSRMRGQLFYRLMSQAVQTSPVPYAGLVLIGGKKPTKPAAPTGTRNVAPTLAQPDAGRPWRR